MPGYWKKGGFGNGSLEGRSNAGHYRGKERKQGSIRYIDTNVCGKQMSFPMDSYVPHYACCGWDLHLLSIPFLESWFAIMLSCFVELCARENSVGPSILIAAGFEFSFLRDRWVSCSSVIYHVVVLVCAYLSASLSPTFLLAALSGLLLRAESHSV